MMDLILRLREARRLAGLTQKQVAREVHINHRTLSSWETGRRISSLKVVTLHRILRACGLTELEFYGPGLEQRAMSFDHGSDWEPREKPAAEERTQ